MATTETTTPATAESGTHATSATAEHVPASEEGAHFPPLDSSTFSSQLLWLAIFFGLLYWLMSKLVLPRIASILDARSGHIQNDLAKAKALQEQTTAAVQAYEKAFADARVEAQAIATETRGKLSAEVEEQRRALDDSLSKKIASAESRIANSRAKAMSEVKNLAGEAAASIVEQLTGAKVTKTAVAKALGGKG
jgi:F-type H+-transporting ATPase subunit b